MYFSYSSCVPSKGGLLNRERSLSRSQMDGDIKLDWRIHRATFWREWLHKKKALTDTPEALTLGLFINTLYKVCSPTPATKEKPS